jgi:hypothetical protein
MFFFKTELKTDKIMQKLIIMTLIAAAVLPACKKDKDKKLKT